jgi:hypothetical protein
MNSELIFRRIQLISEIKQLLNGNNSLLSTFYKNEDIQIYFKTLLTSLKEELPPYFQSGNCPPGITERSLILLENQLEYLSENTQTTNRQSARNQLSKYETAECFIENYSS